MNAISHKLMVLTGTLLTAFTITVSLPAAATDVPIASFNGAWTSTTAYTPGQIVTYQGASYIALVDNTGAKPTSHPVDWAALAQAGVPLVKDSNGKTLGQYFISSGPVGEAVLMRTISGQYFSVAVSATQLGVSSGGNAMQNLLYTTNDCTGPAYLGLTPTAGLLPLIPLAVVNGTTAYVPAEGTTTTTITVQSQQNTGPTCFSESYTDVVRAVGSTVDLSGFVPPFSVQP